VNMRCHLHPGCPNWLVLNNTSFDIGKKEEMIFQKVWSDIHPNHPIPDVLSQPCCGQFAVSRDAILANSREQYEDWRAWLLENTLDDGVSGRLWEYMWQFVFNNQNNVYCPAMNVCYCDGFGVCLGSPEAMTAWSDLNKIKDDTIRNMKKICDKAENRVQCDGMQTNVTIWENELREAKLEAWERGKEPENRAFEAGRPYKEGDGW
jgi:hypothetical protein